MQSDGIVSHVYHWRFLHDTAPYVQSAHKRWFNNKSSARSFVCVWIASRSFTLFSPCHYLSGHQFCFSVCLYARACIWSGGLRVMPWSCRKLGHCYMYAMRCPVWETASLHVSLTATGNSATTGFFLLTLVCPRNQQAVVLPFAARMYR